MISPFKKCDKFSSCRVYSLLLHPELLECETGVMKNGCKSMEEIKEIKEAILFEDIDFESTPVNAGHMNYEQKLEACSRRVYKYNYSQKPRATKRLDGKIDRTEKRNEIREKKRRKTRKIETKVDMNEDVDNLILIAVEFFGLPPYMADDTKLIMARMWSYSDNFHDLKYENVVLGILMYVVYEDLNKAVTVDFNKYCTYLFGVTQAKINKRQMYQAYEIVQDLYQEVEQKSYILDGKVGEICEKYIYYLSQQLSLYNGESKYTGFYVQF